MIKNLEVGLPMSTVYLQILVKLLIRVGQPYYQ
jgi:hypothetical protein